MDANSQKINPTKRNESTWHFKTIPPDTKKALDFLSLQDWLKDSTWYLAGGTALALSAGHRKSVDLDFFNELSEFDSKKFLKKFSGNNAWKIYINKENTIYGELFGAKVSFIAYPFFVPKQPYLQYGFIKVLAPKDIGVMKIVAISQRGKKRDFFDLFWCAHNIESIESIIVRLKEQYPSVAHNYHHILKALVYFNDAETDPEPQIYFKVTWKEVKKFFTKEIPLIAKKIIK